MEENKSCVINISSPESTDIHENLDKKSKSEDDFKLQIVCDKTDDSCVIKNVDKRNEDKVDTDENAKVLVEEDKKHSVDVCESSTDAVADITDTNKCSLEDVKEEKKEIIANESKPFSSSEEITVKEEKTAVSEDSSPLVESIEEKANATPAAENTLDVSKEKKEDLNVSQLKESDPVHQKNVDSLKKLCEYKSESSGSEETEDDEEDSDDEESEESDDTEDEKKPLNIENNYRKPTVGELYHSMINKVGESSSDSDDSSEETEDSEESSEESSSDSSDIQIVQIKRPVSKKPEGTKTKGEITVDDLPPIEDLQISVQETDCELFGYVLNIVNSLVVVQSLKKAPALDIESILFLDHGKVTLGRIFDVFGPVAEPCYSVRFNSASHAQEKGVEKGVSVYYAPRTEHSSFIFVSDLMKMKGSDASWEYNNEPPEKYLDYSDDEEERNAKKRPVKEKEGETGKLSQYKYRMKRFTPPVKPCNSPAPGASWHTHKFSQNAPRPRPGNRPQMPRGAIQTAFLRPPILRSQGPQTVPNIQAIQTIQGTQIAQNIQGIQTPQTIQGKPVAQNIQGIQNPQTIQSTPVAQNVPGIPNSQTIKGTQVAKNIQGIQNPQITHGTYGSQPTHGAQAAHGTYGTQAPHGAHFQNTATSWPMQYSSTPFYSPPVTQPFVHPFNPSIRPPGMYMPPRHIPPVHTNPLLPSPPPPPGVTPEKKRPDQNLHMQMSSHVRPPNQIHSSRVAPDLNAPIQVSTNPRPPNQMHFNPVPGNQAPSTQVSANQNMTVQMSPNHMPLMNPSVMPPLLNQTPPMNFSVPPPVRGSYLSNMQLTSPRRYFGAPPLPPPPPPPPSTGW